MRVDEDTIYFDDSPVFYRSAPTSGVTKLYLHGIPTSSDDWVDFLSRTGGVAPDLRGFGRSGKGGHLDYSLTGLAEFVERLLAHLGAEVVQVIGHDWGAAVGMTLARRQPERVQKLLLCNPPPLLPGFDWPRLLEWLRIRGVGELVMGATTRALLARTLRRGSVRDDAWSDARIATVWQQFDQGTQRAILRLVRSAGDNSLGDSGARTPPGRTDPHDAGGRTEPLSPRARTDPHDPPRWAGATTLIWGENDPWYPPALGEAYAAFLGAELELIAGAGHWPWLDRPDVVDRVAALLEA